jgi:hypothetical protein
VKKRSISWSTKPKSQAIGVICFGNLMFWVLVPCTHTQSIEIDRKNGNTSWRDSEKTKMVQLAEYKTFIDEGVGGNAPDGYKKR